MLDQCARLRPLEPPQTVFCADAQCSNAVELCVTTPGCDEVLHQVRKDPVRWPFDLASSWFRTARTVRAPSSLPRAHTTQTHASVHCSQTIAQSVTQLAEFGELRTAGNRSLPWCMPVPQPEGTEARCTAEHDLCVAIAAPATTVLYAHSLASALQQEVPGAPIVTIAADGAPVALHPTLAFLAHVVRNYRRLPRTLAFFTDLGDLASANGVDGCALLYAMCAAASSCDPRTRVSHPSVSTRHAPRAFVRYTPPNGPPLLCVSSQAGSAAAQPRCVGRAPAGWRPVQAMGGRRRRRRHGRL